MSSTVNNSFITQYTAEITALYEQEKSLLRDAVRVLPGIRGSSFKVPVGSNKPTASTKSRGADLAPAGIDVPFLSFNVAATYAAEWIERFDELQTNLALRPFYTQRLVTAMQRKMDSTIVTALGTTTTSDLGSSLPSANTLDAAGVRRIAKFFNQKAVPQDGRVLLIHSGGLDQMAADAEVSNKFYFPDEILKKGYVDNYFGFKVIRIVDESLLPTTTVSGAAAHTCYAWHMDAAVLGVSSDIEVMVDRIPLKDLDQIAVKMLIGAGVTLNDGVVPVTVLD